MWGGDIFFVHLRYVVGACRRVDLTARDLPRRKAPSGYTGADGEGGVCRCDLRRVVETDGSGRSRKEVGEILQTYK